MKPAIPPLPPARSSDQDGGAAVLSPRYEDITQDGRMQLVGLLPGMGRALWGELLQKRPETRVFRKEGILPIFHRLVVDLEDRPCAVSQPVHCNGSFRYAQEKGGERLFLLLWCDASAVVAETQQPKPPASAPRELVGRMWAEHVFTKPFAPPAERKVTRRDLEGIAPLPDEQDEHAFETAEMLLAGTGGPLAPLGDFVFTKMHSDSNRHVNSLVYPRVFEELLVRRLVEESNVRNAAELLVRAIDIRWRKPFFVGQTARLRYRVESVEGGVVTAVGGFFPDASADAKPSTMLRVVLR